MAEKRPFRAYSGNGKYLFASYSHSDSQKVYEVLGELFCSGCNIWYDQGIPNNSVIDRKISDAINGCSLFVIFLSKSSAASKYVMGKELPLAQKLGRQIIFVRLYEDDANDYSQICGRAGLASCRGLNALVPDYCRDCRSRAPEPILVDMSNGMDFSKNQLIAAEYYFENDELVLSKYLNFGAINDDKEEIDELRIPDYIAGYPVRKIKGTGVFDELMGETETLFLPDTLVELGSSVFEDTEFETVVLPPSLKRIENSCFASSVIGEADIPYGVESIGESAFEQCEVLEEVVIPATVRKIESCAFAYCTCLRSITIPPQTTDLADDIFGDDEDAELTIFCTQGSAAHKYARKHGLEYEIVSDAEMEREQNVLKESSRKAMECFAERNRKAAEAKKEEMAKTACILSDEADSDAIRPLLDNLRLEGVSFNVMYEPNGTLSDYAAVVMILSETSCAKGTIPAVVPTLRKPVYPIMLDGRASVPEEFSGRFVIHQNDRTFDELYGEVRDWLEAQGCCGGKRMRTSAIASDIEFSFEEMGEVWIQGCSGKEKDIAVPESWLGLPVTGVMTGAFSRMPWLESVTLGSATKTIDYYAFNNCPGLKKIVIPPSVTDIDDDAIYNCPDAVIYGAAGSAAQKYAEVCGISFKAVR